MFYGSLAHEFGFLYIWGVGLVASFFLAWFLSIIVFVLQDKHEERMEILQPQAPPHDTNGHHYKEK